MREDFLDFLDTEYHLVVRFMMFYGANLHDAQDATQHMAAQGWRKVQQGRWDQVRHPQAWARRVALNHYRAERSAQIKLTLTDAEPDTEPGAGLLAAGPEHAELTGQARDVVSLLHRLDDLNCRAVIALDIDGFTTADIADVVGRTHQQVRTLRAKARRHLKTHLAANRAGEGRTTQ
ncbi:RNA polymerase sigma factor [Actinomadura kijaniata]|uniref:RNA polymerase sigma factor n=1 Tax=Actinomadura kijaniata TaxID=46161 RepID=UPI000829E7D3|nr:sigma-70 family RNA polymerase sigma factor [Actinomadura kijaniata]